MTFCENMRTARKLQETEQGSARYGATKFADLTSMSPLVTLGGGGPMFQVEVIVDLVDEKAISSYRNKNRMLSIKRRYFLHITVIIIIKNAQSQFISELCYEA